MSEIDSENIRSEVLDQNYVSPFVTDKGAQVLVLDPEATTPLIQEMFYGESTVNQSISASYVRTAKSCEIGPI